MTAFLILAIVPLSTISWYATTRGRQEIQREVTAKLSFAATMVETQVRRWVAVHMRVAEAAFLATVSGALEDASVLTASGDEASDARDTLRTQLCAVVEQDPAFRFLAVLDDERQVLVSTDPEGCGSVGDFAERSRGARQGVLAGQKIPLEVEADASRGRPGSDGMSSGLQFITLDPTADVGLVVTQSIGPLAPPKGDGGAGVREEGGNPLWLTGWLNLSDLAQDIQTVGEKAWGHGSVGGGEVYLVDSSGMALPDFQHGQTVTSLGIEAALAGESGEGLYDSYAGVPVIGVYRWNPELGLAVVAEQAQGEAFAATDNVTAAVIGATLIVALITAVIAAVVTRQITRPVVRLTESALNIAEGSLEQRVPITSRDEIGILAYVFNGMAAELKTLYDDLEGKVARRTALLQQANYQIQRRAIQMQTSLEVGQAVTSILDPDRLLEQVVQVVKDRFAYSHAAVYTVEMNNETDADGRRPGSGRTKEVLFLRASTGQADPFHGQQVAANLPGPVWRAFWTGKAVVESRPLECVGREVSRREVGPPASYARSEVALPLRLGDRTLGVLDVQNVIPPHPPEEEQESADGDVGFDRDEVSVLQNVANQIVIALENARAYALSEQALEKERETARRLRQTEAFRSRFLGHMSHELREPLTNIIGFSRLILKGLDGPISDQQRQDLQIVYANSQHLLGLINDLLDISQIEAGLMELQFQELNLAEIIKSVMSTASALVRDDDIELRQEIAPDLPTVQADAARIRQVLLRLLANAAKFTAEGTITVRAWSSEEQVLVSVSDTGMGITPEDQDRMFEQFEQGTLEDGRRPNGAGLGLALSKEFVEMHGGRIWVESQEGKGSTFTLSLPLRREGRPDGAGRK